MTNLINAVEGEAEVPGGTLRYRLSGPPDADRCVVFENGWGASFPYALRLEAALSQRVRVVCYDRAGIGESRRTVPLTTAVLTQQLLALLKHLKIDTPVTMAGHSHGGLMAALHAAQAPTAIRAIVQIDPTPEFADPYFDRLVRVVKLLARVSVLRARWGLRESLFSANAANLPPEAAQRLLRSCCTPSSMRAAIEELKLLPATRAAIALNAKSCPRLVISAATTRPAQSRLQQRLGAEAAARRTVDVMQGMARRQAALNVASRWEALPYDHGGLVTDPAGAADVAALIFAFDP
jgi:pimeloyl-ACP methyl ester carboxylesterase